MWNWEASADSCFLRTIVWRQVNVFREMFSFFFPSFFLAEWIYLNERKKEWKPSLSVEKWGIIACPCWDVRFVEWGLMAPLAFTWEGAIYRSLCAKLLIIPDPPPQKKRQRTKWWSMVNGNTLVQMLLRLTKGTEMVQFAKIKASPAK